MRDLPMLWVSNSPNAPTGYGNQTALFTPRISAAGYPITLFSFYGREGGGRMVNSDGLIELARFDDLYGQDVLKAHYDSTGSRLLFTLIDFWVYLNVDLSGMKIAAWLPIDDMPMKWANTEAVKQVHYPIAMSKFGLNQLQLAGRDDALYCPHGVDTNVFMPGDRAAAREKIGLMLNTDLGGKYLIIDNAANKGVPSRKNFAGLFLTFAEFARTHEDAVLYIHTDPVAGYGENLHRYVELYELQGKVFFPPRYHYRDNRLPAEMLNDLYNAGDVMLHLALGEGFGIPCMEAQASGCPTIVTEGTAMTELCGSGWTVKAYPVAMGAEGSFMFNPLVSKALERLEEAYALRDDTAMREKVREFSLQYDADKVFNDFMLPILDRIAQENPEPKAIRRLKRQAVDVSVVIPAYGCEKTIAAAVCSALEQQGVNVEVIAVNNGSPDGVGAILTLLAAEHSNIKALTIDSTSYADAMNTAAQHARGRYIQVLEGDDTLAPGALAGLVQALDSNPTKGFAYGDVQYHGALNHRWQPGAFNREDFYHYSASLYPVMFRRELFGKVTWWQSKAGAGISDWDLNIQLAKHSEGLPVPGHLVLHYHYSPNGLNGQQKAREKELMAELRERHPEVTAEAIP